LLVKKQNTAMHHGAQITYGNDLILGSELPAKFSQVPLHLSREHILHAAI